MLDIKEFQRATTRLEELQNENLKDKATLEKYGQDLEDFKDRPGPYAAVKEEIEDVRAKILKGYAERESLKKYVREHQASVGREILDYLKLLRSEADSYLTGSNKAFSALKSVVFEIKTCITEIDSLLPLIQHIHDETSNDGKIANEHGVETNASLGEQILFADCEFSRYVLHSKRGYSLKSFFHDQAPHIRQVLEHYDYDYQATLLYLQTRHGLCSGQVIGLKTFEALCTETFGVKKNLFGLCLNGKAIEGETNTAIFINGLHAIGLHRIIARCSSLFNSSFAISQYPIATTYGVHRQLEENGILFHIRCHSSDGVKLKQLEQIQELLGLDLTITLT